MALDKPLLNRQLHAAYTDAWNRFILVLENNAASGNLVNKPQPEAIRQAATVFADQVSDAVDSYIKSAKIIIPQGIRVGVNANSTAPASALSTGDSTSSTSPSSSTSILTAADISAQINSASYYGTSTQDSPEAKIS